MSLNLFDKVYYINCEHRVDRKDSIESMFSSLEFSNYERIEACYIPENGALGCAKSHLLALGKAKENNFENVLILEDDFTLAVDVITFNNSIQKLFNEKVEWDVIMISSNLVKYEKSNIEYLSKVVDAQTTSGYAVNKKYLGKLIQNFQESESLLTNAERVNGWYKDAIDQYWKKLQKDNWFCFNPVLGKQADGYSDIEKRDVNYGC